MNTFVEILLIPASLPTVKSFSEVISFPLYCVFGIIILAEYWVDTPTFEMRTFKLSLYLAPILYPSITLSGKILSFSYSYKNNLLVSATETVLATSIDTNSMLVSTVSKCFGGIM